MLMDMAAVDHLSSRGGLTVELLRTLTDEQLDEQIEWYQERRDWYHTTPDAMKPESVYKSHAYAAYRYSNWVATATWVRDQRHLNAASVAD